MENLIQKCLKSIVFPKVIDTYKFNYNIVKFNNKNYVKLKRKKSNLKHDKRSGRINKLKDNISETLVKTIVKQAEYFVE